MDTLTAQCAHSISTRCVQIASHSQLHHHISHRSQEFNLSRLHMFYAATVACSSQMSSLTPSLTPPPVHMPCNDGVEQEGTRECAHKVCAARRRVLHPLAHQSARKQVLQSVAQCLLPFSHTVPPHASRARHSSTLLRPCRCHQY